MRHALQHLKNERCKFVLFAMQSEWVWGLILQQGCELESADHALRSVTHLPSRHDNADLKELFGNARGLQDLKGRRVKRSRAQVKKQFGMGLEYKDRNVPLRQRERADQPHGAPAHNDHTTAFAFHLFPRRKLNTVYTCSAAFQGKRNCGARREPQAVEDGATDLLCGRALAEEAHFQP